MCVGDKCLRPHIDYNGIRQRVRALIEPEALSGPACEKAWAHYYIMTLRFLTQFHFGFFSIFITYIFLSNTLKCEYKNKTLFACTLALSATLPSRLSEAQLAIPVNVKKKKTDFI